MSPANSYCTRLLSSVAPSAPVRSEAPTTATDLGLRRRSICWLVKRRSVMPVSPSCGRRPSADNLLRHPELVSGSISRPCAEDPVFAPPCGTVAQRRYGPVLAARWIPKRVRDDEGLCVLRHLALVENAEAGLEGLVVEELLGRFLARGDPAELVERFLGADQVVFGVVVSHLAHPADRPLGGAQCVAVLLLEHVGDFLDARLELVGG